MANQEFTDFEVQVELDGVNAYDGQASDPAPAGDWQLLVTHVEHTNSSNNNPMIKCTFEIVAGADGSDAGEAKGKKAYNNYMLNNQTGLGRLKQLMIACGASLGQLRASELMGQTIRATVTHTAGEQKIGADGNPLPPKIFANVSCEMPLESSASAATETAPAKTATPPIMNKAPAATKPANGARRA